MGKSRRKQDNERAGPGPPSKIYQTTSAGISSSQSHTDLPQPNKELACPSCCSGQPEGTESRDHRVLPPWTVMTAAANMMGQGDVYREREKTQPQGVDMV